MSDFKIDASCVAVLKYEEPCSSCGDAERTHYVSLDYGSGATAIADEMCESCANEFADDVRDSLPAEPLQEQP